MAAQSGSPSGAGGSLAHATRAIRATTLDCSADPFAPGPDHGATCLAVIEDALLVIDTDGRIAAHGPAAALLADLPPGCPIDDRRGQLLLPGFVDAHLHAPQLGMIGASGHDLLGWLNRYTFPTEARFADPDLAARCAEAFCDELLRQGTTTAGVFATIHAPFVDALFEAAQHRRLRIAAGRVLMDRNAPPALTDTVETGVRETEALIARWHGKGRAIYAVTPRFAPTSSPGQLEAAAVLWRSAPGLVLQSHLAESLGELDWVRGLFPDARDYTDVYARFGLLGRRALYGHGIHLSESERRVLAETGTAIVHCPTSNLFLGSGLCDVAGLSRDGVAVALGTDIGGGTSTSMLRTMAAAIDVSQLCAGRDRAASGSGLTPVHALWLATRAGAAALGLGHEGGLEPGMTADLVALDPAATPLLAFRDARTESWVERLGVLQVLGDDRAVAGVWCQGRLVAPQPLGSTARLQAALG